MGKRPFFTIFLEFLYPANFISSLKRIVLEGKFEQSKTFTKT